MMNQSVKLAISRMEPTTKAARLRQVMPDIEEKLAAGVQLGAIHKALLAAGFDLSFGTLKTYLYRYRKKERPDNQEKNIVQNPAAPAHLSSRTSLGINENSPEKSATRAPVSMLEIERMMKPDPVEQAERLARYERLAKQQRRGRL